MTSRRVAIVGVSLCLILLGSSFAAAGKPRPNGTFARAGFTPPDFADRDTATVQIGESRVFTATCSCVRQPGTAPCYGSAILEMSVAGAFDWSAVASDICSAAEGETCSVPFTQSFDTVGEFQFRVRCDEDDGTDTFQNPVDGVTISVEDSLPTCTTGETQACPIQDGVCAGSVQTCADGQWQPCDYGEFSAFYEEPEESCDGLDNDCDGRVNFVDLDGDGYGICGGPGVVNELLLSEVNDTDSIEIYEFRNGNYEQVWSSAAGDTNGTSGGGEAGDLTGDGRPEIAIQRIIDSSATRLEVWAFNMTVRTWYRMWASPTQPGFGLKIGDIIDADGDGVNELLVSDRGNHQLVLYAYDGSGFSVESVVQECPNNRGALFIATAGNIDGTGLPEILFQCDTPDPISIRRYDGSAYSFVDSVPVPFNLDGWAMIIDDMETGDVNGDGVADAIFCGNTGQAHVLTYRDGEYLVEFSSQPPSAFGAFSQTCSLGDVTNDGKNDIVVVNNETIQVYAHNGSGYEQVWSDGPIEITPSLGSSFIGDADNDGRNEFVWGRPLGAGYFLYESDDVPATDFAVTESWGTIYGGGTIIIANLNPTNDTAPVDCRDTDPSQGVFEICGDGVDNDCDDVPDEGCDFSFCGDNLCGGAIENESCTSCPDDCGCFGPNCKHGCCGDGKCGKLENTTNCPVDCS